MRSPGKRSPWLSPVRAAGRLWSSVRRPSGARQRHPLQTASTSSSASFHSIPKDIGCPDDYKELKTLGKGSFGEVLLVRSNISDCLYAVKIIHVDCVGDDPTMLEQIRQERHALEVVRGHPHVVCLHNSWEMEQSLFLVLQYIPGRDLFETVRRRKRLDSAAAARYVLQIAMALEYLHSKDIVFRDLKLENVMVNRDTDCAVLTDFGLAKQLDSSSHRTRTICGTIQYMAPEILREEAYGAPVDWWCLGVVAYILLCGRYPFSAGIDTLRYDHGAHDRMVMSRRIEECDLLFPSFVDCAAEVVIRKLMDPEPVDRISSYKQLEPMKWFELTHVEPRSTNHLAQSSDEEDPCDTKPQDKPSGLQGFSGSYLEFLLSPEPEEAATAPDSVAATGGGGGGVRCGPDAEHSAGHGVSSEASATHSEQSTPSAAAEEEGGEEEEEEGEVNNTEKEAEKERGGSRVEPCNSFGAVEEQQEGKGEDEKDEKDEKSGTRGSEALTRQRQAMDGEMRITDTASGMQGKALCEEGDAQDFFAMVRQFTASRKLAPRNKFGASDAASARADERLQRATDVLHLRSIASDAASSSKDVGANRNARTTSNATICSDSDDDSDEGALLDRTPSARDTLFNIILAYQRRQFHDQRSRRSDDDGPEASNHHHQQQQQQQQQQSKGGLTQAKMSHFHGRPSPQEEQHEAWAATAPSSSAPSTSNTLACRTSRNGTSTGGYSTDSMPFVDDAWHDVSELL